MGLIPKADGCLGFSETRKAKEDVKTKSQLSRGL